MAVLISDAVAGAYLAEVAGGGASASGAPRRAAPGGGGAAAAAVVPAAAASSGAEAGEQGASSSPLEPPLWPTFVHPRLGSTRQLQRFSNRVALARWADRGFHSVAAMYEDRLPLFTLAPAPAPATSAAPPTSAAAGPAPPSARACPVLRVRRVPLKRARELAALRGARFAVSLVLEAADVAAPALRALWERAGAALTWLLVQGVGRAAGLVWRGIRAGAGAGGSAQDAPRRGEATWARAAAPA
jgi:hypothetical protein